MRISGADVRKIAIYSNGLGVSGDSPLGGAKKDSEMAGINVHHARGNGIALDGLIDGSENDDVFGDVDDDAAAGEIGDDFVFAGLGLREGWGGGQDRNHHQ